MDVALVYNVKKEENLIAEGDTQPSSRNQTTTHTQTQIAAGADTYAEWDTQETIAAVRNALSLRHSISLVEADEDAFEKVKSSRPDIVFNIAEGRFGVSREAQIAAMLEMLDIPYTGSDPLTLALCLDKSRAKEILSYYNIPTPKFTVISSLSVL